MEDLFSLKNKTILITGGAGHLGSAMSEALAKYQASLYILGKDKYKNIEKARKLKQKYKLDICEAKIADINNVDSVKKVIQEIVEQTGKIDVLINNAAYSKAGNIEDISMMDWRIGIEGTINSNFLITQIVLKQMIEQQHGNIINIASMYGMVAPNPEIYGDSGFNNPANYGAGKAAIIQLTKYIAANYAKQGIRANCISPGPFPNKIVQENKLFVKALSEKNPMGRIGNPEDLQGIIVYLASDSSRYTTGQNIAVDGGWTIW